MPSTYSYLTILTFLFVARAYASFLPHQVRPTSTSDLIGVYNIHPETDIAARPNSCPKNLTTDTFEFQVSRAPSSLPLPKFFNIQIDHRNTLVNGRRCESASDIIATTSSHPFAKGNASEIITAWSAAGRQRPARWISQQFIQAIAKQSFAVGYDFVGRSCRGVRIRAGVGFLWFQPALDIQLGNPGSPGLTLSSRNKYLLLTFANDPWSGCVFVADTVGGQGGFPPGPVSDPSLTGDQEPAPATDEDNSRPEPPSADPSDGTKDTSTDADEASTPEPDDANDSTPVSDESDEETDNETDDEPDDEPVDDTPASDNDGPPEGGNEVFTSEGGDDDPVEEPACFPASASVDLEGGRVVRLAQLEVGHKVRISESQYSDVFFFSHRQIEKSTLHDFIKLSTTNSRHLTLSPDHYLYVNQVLRPAHTVRVGDTLYAADGAHLTVRSVERAKEEGLIAPHTLHGDIIINGIRASTYTAAVHPYLAHYVLLAPVRALYKAGFPGLLNGVLDSGADRLRRIIPRGPELLNRFL